MNARRKRFVRGMVTCALVAAFGVAIAANKPSHPAQWAELELADGTAVMSTKTTGTLVPTPRNAAWQRFTKKVGYDWRGLWDPAREMPSQLFGPGIPVPGSVANPEIARDAARDFVDEHIDLLAPGARPADLVMVDNVLNPKGDLRHVGFEQYAGGMRVLGGGLSVAFKNDRLFFVTSDAYPDVVAAPPRTRVTDATAQTSAHGHAFRRLGLPAGAKVDVGAVRGPVVLPIARGIALHKPARLSYHTVLVVPVRTDDPVGGWDVYVDPRTGEVIAQRQNIWFADGSLGWKLGKRRPASELQTVLARNTETSEGTTDADGVVDLGGGGQVTLDTSGPLVSITNRAGTSVLSATVTATPGQVAVAEVDQTDIPELAVYMTFAYLNFVKEYVRTEINPGLGWLDESLRATVNNSQTCNAYYDGAVNMFSASNQCQNTGVLADVVIHEFGHGLHGESLLGGVRRDGALGEAHGDILSMTIANAPNLGEGFFKSDPSAGLRELDPPGREKRWPDDRTGEAHDDGEIYGGSAWDLRKALVAVHGQEDGVELFNRLWYASVQRASSTPDTYGAIVAEDDDDGDVTNGTPNICVINRALEPHGLVPADADVGTSPSIGTPAVDGLMVSVPFTVPDDTGGDCAVSTIESARMVWYLRDDPSTGGEVEMTQGADQLQAALPSQEPNTVVRYRIEITLSDGTTSVRPVNAADPDYELYIGRTEIIFCDDFESGQGDWVFEGDETWEIGAPTGAPETPSDPFGGANVLATNLAGNYGNNGSSYAEITVGGVSGYDAVRLHYRRWLTVEDGFFDQATISVDGEEQWANLNSDSGNQSDTHHQDREWRFHDVDLTTAAEDDEVTVRFQLDTDQGLELGGWAIDDFCIVGYVPGAAPMCGDGTQDDGEECDDGNNEDGDGCSADCIDEDGGGGGGGGNGADGDEPGGCCQTSDRGGAAGTVLLALFCLVLAGSRRRRR